MATTVTLNSQSFSIPATGDDAWGDEVTNYLVALATGVLSKSGGDFALTTEVDFGATYGLQSKYYKSRPVDGSSIELAVSSAGAVRLGNNESVGWRNAADSADKLLKVNTSNQLEFDGNPLITLALGAADTVLRMNAAGTAYEFAKIANANIASDAAVAYSKLNLADSVVNADIATAAAIAYSKLNLTDSIVNADISASAAIAVSKLAALTASRAVVSDGDGKLAAADVTATELAYLDGVTSAIQTQLDAKEPTLTGGTSAQYFKGDKTLGTFATDVAATAAVTANTAKVSADGSIGTHSDVDVTTSAPVTGDVLTFDGSDWVPGTAATGSGKNYVTNPSAAGNTDGWSASAFSINRGTSGGPRENTTGTHFYYNSFEAGDYVYTRFTLDDADLVAANLLAKLSLQAADATWKIQLFAYSDSGYSSDEEEIRFVDANADGDTFLPATTTDFTTFWTPVSSTKPYLEFRIVDTVGDNTIFFSDVLVGPGDAVSGAAVGPWQSYTPTISGFGTPTITSAHYRQVGESAEVRIKFTSGTSTAVTAQIGLPSGLTTRPLAVVTEPVGEWKRDNSSTSTIKRGTVLADSVARAYVYLTRDDYTTGVGPFTAGNGSVIAASGEALGIVFTVPIAEWAGSGTVGLGTNRVEYVSHDGSAIVYGPSGAAIPTTTPAGTNDQYTITSAFSNRQATDQYRLEIQRGGEGPWVAPDAVYVENIRNDGTNYIGAGVYWDGTDVKIIRGKYRQASSVAWSGLPAGTRWRVVRWSAGVVTGFGQATADVHGLVSLSSDYAATNSQYGFVNYYQTTSFTPDGDFTGGTVRVTRIGNVVTISTTNLTHGSNGGPVDGGAIPSWARPPEATRTVYTDGTGFIGTINVATNGDFSLLYYSAMSTTVARTSSGLGACISYVVA